ncbi:hypothetical protein KW842_05755 [Duganella sp. sic0402]|uniref:hypothetical protein n=1 Tax=Duganella sp. sic0402 TaxID=2854786 RepID=UPI001C437F79|nr:hypothetical protein [Duganella sp. sic0402]MBV7535270.1 hypothetical protein [Duganella sp. sic0402]
MSIISNLGNRLPSLYSGSQAADSKATTLQKTQGVTPAKVGSNPLDLTSRVASVGNATVDFAQDFVNSFTQALFGDDAKGAVIDFDSASLETTSTFAAGVQQSRSGNSVTNAAAFSLTDSSHFVGKGTITTADGRKFDFEVEVQYDAELSAAASQTSNANNADSKPRAEANTDTQDLPVVQLPNLDFPGTLADLFQLIGRNLQSALSSGGQAGSKTDDGIDRSTLRSLSLRLLNLVDSKDTNTYAAPTAADKAKAAAGATDAEADAETAAPVTAETPAPAAEAPATDTAAPPSQNASV